MGKRKTKKQSAKTTLAEVMKEMAKPRVATSARENGHIFRNAVLIVENNVEKRTVNLQPTPVVILDKA
jgi:hypothetical protein